MPSYTQYLVEGTEDILEIPLSGEKLPQTTTSLDVINRYGSNLFKSNTDFIREKVPDTWFVVIEPHSATLIASSSALKAYQHSSQKFPGQLMYVIGLLKNNPINFLHQYA